MLLLLLLAGGHGCPLNFFFKSFQAWSLHWSAFDWGMQYWPSEEVWAKQFFQPSTDKYSGAATATGPSPFATTGNYNKKIKKNLRNVQITFECQPTSLGTMYSGKSLIMISFA